MVRSTLGTLPRGEYKWAPPLVPAPRASSLHIISRSLPTNYLQGYWVGPRADSRDYQPMRIAMAALGGRLFTEVRVKRNLTYAVNAPFVDRAVTAAGLYVTTTAPDSVLGIMRREVESMKRGLIDPEGLRLLVQQFITEFFLDNETNSDQATFLARSNLYRGDYRLASRFVDELRKVTPEDIQRVSRQYLTGITMAYVGDPRRISAARHHTVLVARLGLPVCGCGRHLYFSARTFMERSTACVELLVGVAAVAFAGWAANAPCWRSRPAMGPHPHAARDSAAALAVFRDNLDAIHKRDHPRYLRTYLQSPGLTLGGLRGMQPDVDGTGRRAPTAHRRGRIR